MRLRGPRSLVTGAAFAALLSACTSSTPTPTPTSSIAPTSSVDVGAAALTGAGATFPEPFYTKAFYSYSQLHPGVTVNYQAVGSGAGIKQFIAGTVDFGASDVPMKPAELTAAGGSTSLVEIPSTLGAIAVAYNLAGVDKLNLDGPTLAGIYLGTITNWDNPAIKALNSGASLPSEPIVAVHRSDGSGTTYHFTDYLSKVSPDWKPRVGVGKSVAWPGGVGAKGNAGVANQVQQTEGGVGYVELAYVAQANMKQAFLQNAAGRFVQASLGGATAAAAQSSNVGPDNFSITNQPGADSYPIAGFSWVFIRTAQADPQKGRAVVYLFDWLVTDGQASGKILSYAPLPKAVQTYALDQLRTVTAGGSPILK